MLNSTPISLCDRALSIGAVAVLEALARELGLVKALGTDREGKLALWQVIARVIDQGSRLSAVRLAQTHACCDLLKLDAFNEDDLYSNLAWLTEHQHRIETRLFEGLAPSGQCAGAFSLRRHKQLSGGEQQSLRNLWL